MARPDDDHTCQPLHGVDGQVMAVVHAKPGAADDPRFAEAFAALVAVAARRMADEDPDGIRAARQQAALQRVRDRNARLRRGGGR